MVTESSPSRLIVHLTESERPLLLSISPTALPYTRSMLVERDEFRKEVDRIIHWLTGYSPQGVREQIEQKSDFETFFAQAPAINPSSSVIKGVICGVRVEEIEHPLMQQIRCLDKLVDELARGKAMEKILRE